MSTGAFNALILATALLFMIGFFYYYVVEVHYEDRALSRASALAFLACAVVAVVMLVRALP